MELAIAAPVMMFMLVGLFELGRMFWTNHTLQYAADETSRYAMINRTADTATLTSYASEKLGAMAGEGNIGIATSVAAGVTYVSITVQKPFDFAGGLFGPLALSLTGKSSAPLLP